MPILSPFERMVALRYLRARREEGLISVIAVFSLVGIALGVTTLIVVLSVMRGVHTEMMQSIIGLEGHVSVYARGPGLSDYDGLSARIRTVPGVKSAIPLVQGQVMVSANGASVGSMVSGLRNQDLSAKPLLTQKIISGAFFKGDEQESGVVIGHRMAEKLSVGIGDSITLISPEGRATIIGTVPRVKAYPVVGIFNIGMFAYDNGLVVLPFAEAQHFFKLAEDQASTIEVMGEDAQRSKELAQAINDATGHHFRVYDWQGSNNHLLHAVTVQRNVMFLVLMLIIVVASFNIISSLIMLVREKGRDIAILRTMGATRGMVMRIFIATGASVGIAGTILGVLLGLLISYNTKEIQTWIESITGQKLLADELYFLSSLPAQVSMQEVGLVAALAFILSFLATLYPARRAAALDPAEALRYE